MTSEGQEQITVVNLVHRVHDVAYLERELTKNVINVTNEAIYLITASSVVEKKYSIKDATVKDAIKTRARVSDTDEASTDCQELESDGKVKTRKLTSEFDEELKDLNTEGICGKISSLKNKSNSVPENLIAKCIQKVLITDPTINNPESEQFFDLLIGTPFNESRMMEVLQGIDFKPDSGIEVVNYLISKLSRVHEKKVISEKLIENDDKCELIESSIIDWISLMMNANFKKIVISGTNYEDKLSSLIAKLDEFHNYCLASIQVRNTLESLLRKSGLFDPSGGVLSSIPEYSIDYVTL